MNVKINCVASFAMIGIATLCIAGCGKQESHEEELRRHWGNIKTKADMEKMKADAEAQRRTREEKFSKTIGGAMVKRTMETASGTAKKDKEADAKVRAALDRDFGAPQPKPASKEN